LPHLRTSNGLIVALSSVAGLTGVPTRSGYAATKHALFGFFDSLRIELDGSGVDVTIVAPDFVASEIHKRALQGNGQPLGQSPLDKDKIMPARTCAELIALGMKRRQRLVLTSARGRFARLGKAIAPGLIDRIAKRAIETGH
jgi:short-subunit dehydrogenase